MSARPLRSMRVEAAVWDPAAARAAREGRTVSAVVREALAAYGAHAQVCGTCGLAVPAADAVCWACGRPIVPTR